MFKRYIYIIVLFFVFVLPNFAYAEGGRNKNEGFFQRIGDSFASVTSRAITLNNPVRLDSPKTNFNRSEKPEFTLLIPEKESSRIGKTVEGMWKTEDEVVMASLTQKKTGETRPVQIKKTDEGKFVLTDSIKEDVKPGEYTLTVSAKESFLYTRDLTQDFSWGVLAVNTNKSIYAPGEDATIMFGVVDDLGHTLCNAQIALTVTAPDRKESKLTTENGQIKRSDECRGNTFTLKPDYSGVYQTKEVGKYQMVVTATTENGEHTIKDYFEVRESVPFAVERTQFPTRMYPREAYEVKLTVKAQENYTGTVTDFVPKDFRIYDVSGNGAVVNPKLSVDTSRMYNTALLPDGEQKIVADFVTNDPEAASSSAALVVDKDKNPITWNVSWEQGRTYTLSYTIVFPLKSPEFYLLGPLKAGEFEEIREWQIAGDNVICWDGGGSGNNWTTAANWDGDVAPAQTDVATFGDSGSCAAVVGTPDKDVSINSGFVNPSGTGGGINIQSSYSGIMTQGTGVTVTIGDQGFTQAGGTFTGSASSITIQSGGDFNLSGGTFTSTTGTLTVRDDWTFNGGTFTHNSGTVLLDLPNNDSAATVTGSTTFNNLTIDGRGGSGSGGASITTIASGTTLTVNGTLSLTDDTNTGIDELDGPGGITANGAITLTGKGFNGTGVITLSNTSDQTITGVAATDSFVPGFLINKSSGTVTFVNRVYIALGGWTYSAGTLSFGSSTIGFRGEHPSTLTISGSTTFGNLTFLGQQGSGTGGSSTVAIASGTVLTATGTLTFSDTGTSLSGSDVVNGPGTIQAQGAVSVVGTGFQGTSVVYFTASGSQTVTGEASTMSAIPGININKPSGTLTFVNRVFIGTGGWTNVGGTIDFGSSTIGFRQTGSGASSTTITGSTTFNNLYFRGNDSSGTGETITISSGTTLTVAGTLTLNNPSASGVSVINGPGTLVVQGNIDNDSASYGWGGTVAITFSGTASQTVTIVTEFPDGNVTINKSSGTVTLGSALPLSASGQDLTITSGTLDLAGFNLTVNDEFALGTLGTLKLQGGETVSAIDTFASGSTVEYAGSGTYTSLAAGNTYKNLTISGSGSFTLGANATVTGNFLQSAGTFGLSSFTMTIGGNFARTAGTFSGGTGTVTFNDMSIVSTISGSTTFYNLSSSTGKKQIKFTAGTTQTVSNTLTFQGTAGNQIILDSTSAGSAWNLAASSTVSVAYVTVKDSNASGGNVITATFSGDRGNNTNWTFTGSTAASWYDASWLKRKTVTIDYTKVAGDLSNFPVLINLSSDGSLASNAQSDGDDILFTSGDGTTKLSHEIEKYTTATGALIAWVKVPSLSSTANTILYMYYGNSAASNQQDTADGSNDVFDSNYKMVQHLKETGSCSVTFEDSTSNNNDGACGNTPTSTTGRIGDARNFSSSYIRIPSSASLNVTTATTISGWINQSDTIAGPIMEYNNEVTTIGPILWRFVTYQNLYWSPVAEDATSSFVNSTSIMSTGTWHYIVGTYDGTTVRAYIDGSSVGTPTTWAGKTLRTNGHHFIIGGRHTTSSWFGGAIDEVRISSTARSAEWIATEYNNQNSPSTFYTVQGDASSNTSTQIKGGTYIRNGTRIRAQ